MSGKPKPNWWPENPYPEKIFTMPRKRYAEIVPDPVIRTGLSGMLGREFWDIASNTIWEAVEKRLEQLQAELNETRRDLLEFGRHSEGCSHAFDVKYRCRCGWLKTEQVLKEKLEGKTTNG